jgi:sporulation protein YlmC with PRC-barrel domain
MKKSCLAIVLAAAAFAPMYSNAQVVGSQTIGVTVEESQAILQGWSVRKSILNKPVFNEQGQRVGVIHDIIVAPDRSVSFAIIAANQFLGVAQHDVAIPVEQLDFSEGKLLLRGATKAAMKQIPAFQYAKVPQTPRAREEFREKP